MSDDKNQRGPQDASRVALGENYEVQYWTNRFSVSRDQLEEAVSKVGNGVDAIAAYLSRERTA